MVGKNGSSSDHSKKSSRLQLINQYSFGHRPLHILTIFTNHSLHQLRPSSRIVLMSSLFQEVMGVAIDQFSLSARFDASPCVSGIHRFQIRAGHASGRRSIRRYHCLSDARSSGSNLYTSIFKAKGQKPCKSLLHDRGPPLKYSRNSKS